MSYDVSSLFTNVPVDETNEILAGRKLSKTVIGSIKNMTLTSQKLTGKSDVRMCDVPIAEA